MQGHSDADEYGDKRQKRSKDDHNPIYWREWNRLAWSTYIYASKTIIRKKRWPGWSRLG
jgi:hypothetical protein